MASVQPTFPTDSPFSRVSIDDTYFRKYNWKVVKRSLLEYPIEFLFLFYREFFVLYCGYASFLTR